MGGMTKGNTKARDVEVLSALGRGDVNGAFTWLWSIAEDELRRYVRRMLDDEHDVDDVMSDLGLRILQALPRFRAESSTRTWCFQIARSAVTHFATRPANDRRRRERLSQVPEPAEPSPETRPPYVRTDVKERTRAICDEVLSEEETTLLFLREDRGLSFVECGQVLDCSEEAAKKRFHRALGKLRRALEREGLLARE